MSNSPSQRFATRVLLVGAGNMGAAMASNWLDIYQPDEIAILDPAPGEALKPLLQTGVRHCSNVEACATADTIVLAVKPQALAEVVGQIRHLVRETLIVSVAAGKSIGFIERHLGAQPIIRAMPNTPALIGRGITGAYANALVSDEQRSVGNALLASSGKVEWLATEDSIDAVTAISGSGPAYIFHLAEALATAGTQLGLKPELAMRLAQETIAGAGEMMLRSDRPPDELRRNVTSPKGTTASALAVLMREGGMVDLIWEACRAAELRARELSKDE